MKEQLPEIGFTPTGLESFGLDAELGGVLLEARHGDVAQHREVLAGAGLAYAAVVLAEGHVEAPVQLVLDPPVLAYGAGIESAHPGRYCR